MEPYDPKKRYCGPGKGIIAWLVPEKPLGVCINECCYKHDNAYEKGGTGADRFNADKVFRVNIYTKLVGRWWIPCFLAFWIAQRYYKAVRILGSLCFNYRAVPDERFVQLVKAGIAFKATREFQDAYSSAEASAARAIAFSNALCSAEDLVLEAFSIVIPAEEALAEAPPAVRAVPDPRFVKLLEAAKELVRSNSPAYWREVSGPKADTLWDTIREAEAALAEAGETGE